MIILLIENFAKEWLLSRRRPYRIWLFGAEIAIGSIVALWSLAEFWIFTPILIFYPLWMGVKFYNLEKYIHAKQDKQWLPLRYHIILFWAYLIFATPIMLALSIGSSYLFGSLILDMVDRGVSDEGNFLFLLLSFGGGVGGAVWLFGIPKTVKKLKNHQWPTDKL
ncbi:hypothetical protein [Vibrio superstes]|uniref:Uncharacterized protein n=1 Tax=Vibrio superstes NBRC 103154 TaxID=1219062 RepID=A0A511QME0_9VIBR|nr:hypothetical protein [Vibrio superstes]GEM78495.1 hypothetical protein VSU01S_07400 [Vibrio superstes NBRC 103154]